MGLRRWPDHALLYEIDSWVRLAAPNHSSVIVPASCQPYPDMACGSASRLVRNERACS